jgi:hypothetical protein
MHNALIFSAVIASWRTATRRSLRVGSVLWLSSSSLACSSGGGATAGAPSEGAAPQAASSQPDHDLSAWCATQAKTVTTKWFDSYRVIDAHDGYDDAALGSLNAVWGTELFNPVLATVGSEDALAAWAQDPNTYSPSFDESHMPDLTAWSGYAFIFDADRKTYCHTAMIMSSNGLLQVNVGLHEWGGLEMDSAGTHITLTPTYSRAALGDPSGTNPLEWKDYPLTARTYTVATVGLNMDANFSTKSAFSGLRLIVPRASAPLTELFHWKDYSPETETFLLRRAN